MRTWKYAHLQCEQSNRAVYVNTRTHVQRNASHACGTTDTENNRTDAASAYRVHVTYTCSFSRMYNTYAPQRNAPTLMQRLQAAAKVGCRKVGANIRACVTHFTQTVQ